jgi:REP element-mobilizing transposase RayT
VREIRLHGSEGGGAEPNRLSLPLSSSTLRVVFRRGATMGRSRYKFGESDYPHFLICTVVGWLPVFTQPETLQVLFDSWRFLQDQDRMALLGYVVLDNHIHFIAASKNLAKEVGDFKSYTARRIIDHLQERRVHTLLDGLEYHRSRHKIDRTFQLWQEGSHPKIIDSEVILRQKLEYIHANLVKRGFVDEPTHWRYSSARNDAKLESLLNLTTE